VWAGYLEPASIKPLARSPRLSTLSKTENSLSMQKGQKQRRRGAQRKPPVQAQLPMVQMPKQIAQPLRKRRQQGQRSGSIGAAAAAAAYSVGLRSGEPTIRGSSRSTRIQHRELIASITGSTTFTVSNTFALNPGLPGTFPWLSTQAAGWEQYKFHRLKFCYYSRCATSVPGSMMLVPDYDAADAAPITEQVASSYRDVVEEVPWTPEFTCVLDVKAMIEPGDRKYVRIGALPANLDVKTYDSGTLFACTTDGTAVNWGKLWVEYDVELFVPQLPPQGAGQLIYSSGGTIGTTNIFGSAPVSTGPIYATAAVNVVTFPTPGYYFVSLSLINLSGAAATSTSATTNMTIGATATCDSGTTASYCAAINVTQAVGTMTFANADTQSTSVAGLSVSSVSSVFYNNWASNL